MQISAYFSDNGTPKTGLSPTIRIIKASDDTLVVSDQAMTEVGDGFYKYDFAAFDNAQEYMIRCDGGAALFANDRYCIADTGDSGEISQIQDKTVNLPADPASQAAVVARVGTAETNIRGPQSDSLKTLSDQMDSVGNQVAGVGNQVTTVDAVVDAVKTKTDNLPADPASQAAVTGAISTSESNIRGGADNLAVLSDQLDTNLTAVQGIQNNTTRRVDVPARLIVPNTGSTVYRFIVGLYDMQGNPEIPDAAPTVQVENISGVERLAAAAMTKYTGQDGQYYFDYTVPSTATLEKLIVAIKLVEGGVTTYHRRSTEVTEFEADINEIQAAVTEIKTKTDKLPTNTAQELTDVDNAVAAVQGTLDDSVTGLAPIKGAVDTVDTVADGIKAKTDNLPVNTATELDNIDTAIANTHSAVTSGETNVKALLQDATYGLNALKLLLDAIDTNAESKARFDEIKGTGWTTETLVQIDGLLDVVKGKTDNLPLDTAAELVVIDTEIAGIRERTNRLPDDPADESNVLGAISTAESNIRGVDGDSLKTISDHMDTVEGKADIIDTVADGIKVKTDKLPVNTAAELDSIDTEIAGVRGKTDKLPVNTALELNSLDTEVAGVRGKTDRLPVDTALELNNIDIEIAGVRERTDRLPDDPADESNTQAAIQASSTANDEAHAAMVVTDTRREAKIDIIGIDMKHTRDTTQEAVIDINNTLAEIRSMNMKIESFHADDIPTTVELQSSLDTMEARLTNILGTLQSDVTFVRGMEGGRWKIIGTQMVFYGEDNATELARFNLLDDKGMESATNVFERQRV